MYGCSSKPGGEVGVTGWWQQMVNATGWIMHFLKEISTDFNCHVYRKETEVRHSGVPLNRA